MTEAATADGEARPAINGEEMAMLWLKGCQRCGGDLNSSRDEYGPYIACIQCDALRDAPARSLADPRPSA